MKATAALDEGNAAPILVDEKMIKPIENSPANFVRPTLSKPSRSQTRPTLPSEDNQGIIEVVSCNNLQ